MESVQLPACFGIGKPQFGDGRRRRRGAAFYAEDAGAEPRRRVYPFPELLALDIPREPEGLREAFARLPREPHLRQTQGFLPFLGDQKSQGLPH